MARMYANENFPRAVVERLRQLGHDMLTSREAGKADQAVSDDEVLRFAIAENRAVLTLNRHDFIRLHKLFAAHWGIVVCTYDPDFDSQASRIAAAVEGVTSLEGQLLRVNRPS